MKQPEDSSDCLSHGKGSLCSKKGVNTERTLNSCQAPVTHLGFNCYFNSFASYMHLNDFSSLFFRFKKGHYRLNVLPGSKLNIICPHVAVSLVERQDTDTGFNCENFWRVDFNSYQTCNVNENSIPQNKIFLSCDDPRQMQFETLVFQPFNADPSRVFKKGKVYYFICKCVLCLIIFQQT